MDSKRQQGLISAIAILLPLVGLGALAYVLSKQLEQLEASMHATDQSQQQLQLENFQTNLYYLLRSDFQLTQLIYSATSTSQLEDSMRNLIPTPSLEQMPIAALYNKQHQWILHEQHQTKLLSICLTTTCDLATAKLTINLQQWKEKMIVENLSMMRTTLLRITDFLKHSPLTYSGTTLHHWQHQCLGLLGQAELGAKVCQSNPTHIGLADIKAPLKIGLQPLNFWGLPITLLLSDNQLQLSSQTPFFEVIKLNIANYQV